MKLETGRAGEFSSLHRYCAGVRAWFLLGLLLYACWPAPGAHAGDADDGQAGDTAELQAGDAAEPQSGESAEPQAGEFAESQAADGPSEVPSTNDEYEIRIFDIKHSILGDQVDVAQVLGRLMNVPVLSVPPQSASLGADGQPLKGTGLNSGDFMGGAPGSYYSGGGSGSYYSSGGSGSYYSSGGSGYESSGQMGYGYGGGQLGYAPDESGYSPGVGPPGVASAVARAYIVAYPRLNELYVRDLKSRIPTYERLIDRLDRPAEQIEIEVSIIDVDASEVLDLELAWRSRNVGISPSGFADSASTAYYDSTLDAEEFSGLIVQIEALRDRGKSQIISQPTLVTLNNHVASFRNDSTFYVRLGGIEAEVVDLVPVTYGEQMTIQPHIIHDGDRRRILMHVDIQDGARQGQSSHVTDVPEVAENVISTRAVVDEGESLLIGGQRNHRISRSRKRLPLVGDLPVIGALFGSTTNIDIAIARYFVISPRILPVSVSHEVQIEFESENLSEEFDEIVVEQH